MHVHRDLGREVVLPMKIQVDNAAGISFQKSTCASSKLRGIFDMAEKWIHELKNEKNVEAVKVDTTKNLADMFTKCLSYPVRKALEDIIQKTAEEIAK